MKVLVIEDDPSLREIICRSLEKERYVTEEAPDFQTALEKTADYTYDCILLDIMLPDGNGLDLLEELKKENKKENIIIISAKDSLEDKVTGLDLGADDYLPKPFHLAELIARVKSVIRRNHHAGATYIEYGNIRNSRCGFLDRGVGVLSEREFFLEYTGSDAHGDASCWSERSKRRESRFDYGLIVQKVRWWNLKE